MLSRLIIIVIVVAMLGAAIYGSTRYVSQLNQAEPTSMMTHTVAQGDLVITVTEDGNLESASNVDIKCQVAGGSAILWIVDDGEVVKKGDKLVELDAAALDEQINQQRITLEKARSTMVQAEKDYVVAEISVKEFLEGTYVKDIQDKDAQITISLENLRSAENSLQHSERMFRKGYISSLELESQQFAVQRAKLELESAKTAKEVLEKFTKAKTMEDLQSQVTTAKARLESEKAAFALEESKLKRLESQREYCTIAAPQDGMVVYANEGGSRFGGAQSVTVEEGAAVRERQTILRLPDLSQMQVKVLVHESKVESLGRNMRARIRIQDRELQGTVTNVANQPEPGSFFSANVKEYATYVRIDGQPQGLKPGMTAEVEILIAHLKEAISLPVACVVEQRGKFFCWVKTPTDVERRELVLGLSNDQYVEVKDGVSPGDLALLNPRAAVPDARLDPSSGGVVDVNEKFGKSDAAGRGDGVGPPPGAGGPRGPGGPPNAEQRGSGSPRGPGGASPEGAGPGGAPGAGGPRGEGPGGGPGGGGGGRSSFDLMASDKDGDGKVSKDEAPERVQQFFDMIDSNQDGFIDRSETEASRRRMQQRGGPGGGGPGGGPGADGPGGGPGAGGPGGGGRPGGAGFGNPGQGS